MALLSIGTTLALVLLLCAAAAVQSIILGGGGGGSVVGIGVGGAADFASAPRQCEPIRIEMCRGIGYNETSMPNLVGHELQADVEFTLQTFAPLIEYLCSTQLKLFLCAAYVPMCTPKVPVPIGPCRSLCESVRSHCHPVLQGFGFPWPPALDCARFPRENNNETMCMEGPGEALTPSTAGGGGGGGAGGGRDAYGVVPVGGPEAGAPLECPSGANAHLYVKLHRSGRCAPKCDADILFAPHMKHLAEVWAEVWTYAALGLAVVATLCLILGGNESRTSAKWARILTPLVWCHDMVAVGWTVRFVSGRTATACGYDPQLPNVSLLLVDGLSNASCAATFILRYYFGMAACVWWAILCLGWHRELRRNSPDAHGHIALGSACTLASHAGGKRLPNSAASAAARRDYDVTRSNFARFAAWGLPAFQTAAVIVARLVDADELLGACFVGNQSDKGLQILVATPLFCYWIFGSMNLISGYLVHRRNREILQTTNAPGLQHQLQAKGPAANAGIGTFLFIYCVPCALLLLAVIYEFANIDIWLNVPAYMKGIATPMWPFLTRAFMELMLGIICSAWVLGPKISTLYKRQMTPRMHKQAPPSALAVTAAALHQHQQQQQQQQHHLQHQQQQQQQHPHAHAHHHHPQQLLHPSALSGRGSNIAYSTVSYQTVRQPTQLPHAPTHSSGTVSMNHMPHHYSLGRQSKSGVMAPPTAHHYVNRGSYKKQKQQYYRYGNETIL